jgi:hypothetical protein
MKRLVLLIIPALLLAVGMFFLFQSITNARMQKGALQVTATPTSKVYLNDHYLGQTPLCECDSGSMITQGDYTIRVVPLDTSLSEFQDRITISEGVLTVVDRKFGKDSLSEGSIISLSPLPDKNDSQLLVVSFPEGAAVSLDDTDLGNTPLVNKKPTESDHIVRVSKNGYNDKTVRIRTPLGYKLTISVYLSTLLTGPTPTPQAITPSPSATTTPSPSLAMTVTPIPKVGASALILDTPTGFLRVRDNPSLDGSEIAEVKPGQKFPLLNEQDGWYEIQLTDGTTGWISTQYAEKK